MSAKYVKHIYIHIYIYIFKVITELDSFVSYCFLKFVVEGVDRNLEVETSSRETDIITAVYIIINLCAKFR